MPWPRAWYPTFDSDFLRVPRDLRDTQMRVDFSTLDDDWGAVVAGAVSKNKKSKTRRSLDNVGGNHIRWLEEEFWGDDHYGKLSRRDSKFWHGSRSPSSL